MNALSVSTRFLIAALLAVSLPLHADQDWDGDNSVGNFSFNNNWYGNNQPAWGFANGNFNINFRNGGASSLFYDYGGWVDTNNITWMSGFNSGVSLDGNGNGINFNQKLENQSSFTQTIGSTMNLSGAKNGASKIELNPVNGGLTINGTIFNDNSRPYEVWGNNGNTLTLGSALGVGATAANVSLTLQQNSTVVVSAQQTYSGGTVLNAGTLNITGGAVGGNGAIRGTATVNSGATMRWSTGDAAGYSGGAASLTTINLNGGALDVNVAGNQTLGNTTINMTGASITGLGSSSIHFFGGSSAINTLASSTTSTISGSSLALRQNGGLTINVADGAAATDLRIDSVISDFSGFTNNSLNKTGAGTMTLTAINTYTGGTNVSAGVLNLGAGGGAGTVRGALSISSGATVNTTVSDALGFSIGAQVATVNVNGGTFNNSTANNQGFSTNFNMTGGAVTSTGGGAINFNTGFGITTNAATTTATWTAPTLIRAGNLTITTAAGTAPSGIDLAVSGNISASSGTSSLIKEGSGTLGLSGNHTYTGGTTINAGTLALTGGGGAVGVIRGAVTINSGGTLRLATPDATGYTANRISSITVNEGGTVYVATSSGNQTVNAAINLTGSTFSGVAGSNVDLFGNGSSVTTNASATSSVISTTTFNLRQDNTTFTVANGAANVDLLVTSTMGDSSGEGNNALIKAGAGLMAVSGNNSFTGQTTVNAGTLRVDANNALGSTVSGTSIANGATLLLNGVNYSTAEALSINGSGISGGGALSNSGTSTFAGQVTAATNASIHAGGGTLNLTGGVVKNGTTLTLTGGGRINISGTGISGASANSDLVVDGTTVVVSANSNFNGPTTVQNSGTLVANATVQSTNVTIANGSTLSGTGRVEAAVNNYVYLNGALVVGNSTLGSPVASQLEIATSGTGSTVLGSGSTMWFDLFSNVGDNSALLAAADRIRLFGTLDPSLGGTLMVSNPNALSGFNIGDRWRLFDLTGGGSISGSLTVDYTSLILGPTMTGSFNSSTGIFSIIAVPEPSRAVLVMVGVMGLVMRRRRCSSGL